MEVSEYHIANGRIELPGPGKLRVCKVACQPREELLLSQHHPFPPISRRCVAIVFSSGEHHFETFCHMR